MASYFYRTWDFAAEGGSVVAMTTADADYPAANLADGLRYTLGRDDASGTGTGFEFRLGSVAQSVGAVALLDHNAHATAGRTLQLGLSSGATYGTVVYLTGGTVTSRADTWPGLAAGSEKSSCWGWFVGVDTPVSSGSPSGTPPAISAKSGRCIFGGVTASYAEAGMVAVGVDGIAVTNAWASSSVESVRVRGGGPGFKTDYEWQNVPADEASDVVRLYELAAGRPVIMLPSTRIARAGTTGTIAASAENDPAQRPDVVRILSASWRPGGGGIGKANLKLTVQTWGAF